MEVTVATEREPLLNRNLAVLCAVLHTCGEDAKNEKDAEKVSEGVLAMFGPGVHAGVLALTKNLHLPKSERMANSLRRIREQPREVWLVKLGDPDHEPRTAAPAWSREKRRSYLEEAMDILEKLGEAGALLQCRFKQNLAEYQAHL
jgi:GTP diphosphokinase / guanosine-3',5'-bis(diphosphate) 3'-diphosphatase